VKESARPWLALVRGDLEVVQDPRVVRRNLTGHTALIEILEERLGRLAERPGFRDRDGHGLGATPLSHEGRAHGVVVAIACELWELGPERHTIVAKRLLRRAPVDCRAARLAERRLTQLAERDAGLGVSLLGSA
jgi:hypothetical protein